MCYASRVHKVQWFKNADSGIILPVFQFGYTGQYMTEGKLCNVLGLGLLIGKIEIVIVPTSQGCCEELMR